MSFVTFEKALDRLGGVFFLALGLVVSGLFTAIAI